VPEPNPLQSGRCAPSIKLPAPDQREMRSIVVEDHGTRVDGYYSADAPGRPGRPSFDAAFGVDPR
jgi:hypothetical protein